MLHVSEQVKSIHLRKLTAGSLLVALTVSLSGFSIPVGASKCFPIQHLINILAAVFLGPIYGVSMAFASSLIRNLLGTGSLLAFPGSMAGAFLGAWFYKKSGKLVFAYLGEIIGTGIIGALLSFPAAALFMGKEVAVFFYVIPFLISTTGGTILGGLFLGMLRQMNLFTYITRLINE